MFSPLTFVLRLSLGGGFPMLRRHPRPFFPLPVLFPFSSTSASQQGALETSRLQQQPLLRVGFDLQDRKSVV